MTAATTVKLTAAEKKAAELKAARGTKRTCQNSDCEERFYDLKRDPIQCPICGAPYVVAVVEPEKAVENPAPVAAKPATEEKPDEVDEDAAEVSDIEADDSEPADDTFLESDDEEGSDVTGIIGTAGKDKEEEV